MPKLPQFIVHFSLLSSLLFATGAFAADPIETTGLDLSLGHRSDQLRWSIAGNNGGSNPTILSELTWDNLKIQQLQLDGFLESKDFLWLGTNNLFVGSLAYGRVYSGDNQDSDYAGDNRTLEWSRSNNRSDDGYTFDASGGLGPRYLLASGKVKLAPLIGYSVHIQDLRMEEGFQTVSQNIAGRTPHPLGPIVGLDSTYTAYWYGPWLGLNLQIMPVEKLSLEISSEYHIVEFFAEADWNLRTDLEHPVSFEQEAEGSGFVLSLKSVYELNLQWSAVFTGDLQFWKAEDGNDKTFFADGRRGGTRLNEVDWDSYATMLGLRYQF